MKKGEPPRIIRHAYFIMGTKPNQSGRIKAVAQNTGFTCPDFPKLNNFSTARATIGPYSRNCWTDIKRPCFWWRLALEGTSWTNFFHCVSYRRNIWVASTMFSVEKTHISADKRRPKKKRTLIGTRAQNSRQKSIPFYHANWMTVYRDDLNCRPSSSGRTALIFLRPLVVIRTTRLKHHLGDQVYLFRLTDDCMSSLFICRKQCEEWDWQSALMLMRRVSLLMSFLWRSMVMHKSLCP